ncbi:hypothetical protein ACTXT7_017050, partial [Hymenolepis weldensis]
MDVLLNQPDSDITNYYECDLNKSLIKVSSFPPKWVLRDNLTLLRYEGINITNYTSSWRDGLAFLAIINQQ